MRPKAPTSFKPHALSIRIITHRPTPNSESPTKQDERSSRSTPQNTVHNETRHGLRIAFASRDPMATNPDRNATVPTDLQPRFRQGWFDRMIQRRNVKIHRRRKFRVIKPAIKLVRAFMSARHHGGFERRLRRRYVDWIALGSQCFGARWSGRPFAKSG